MKTRLAPTPSGYLHLGNVLSFALTAFLARKEGASLLLRIDDMDGDRKRPEYVRDVFDTLRFLDLRWDEGPHDEAEFEEHFAQRHRLPRYTAALQRLAEEGRVYACTCSRTTVLQASADGRYPGTCREKNIPLDTPGASWRIRTDARALQLHRYEQRVETGSLPAAMRDFVVRRRDGLPAYQLTSPIDDVHFGVDFVVRGADLLDSTWAQLFLADVLEEQRFCRTLFLHHPLLQTADGRKLSKSAGDTSVRHHIEQGEGREALLRSVAATLGLPGCGTVHELGAAWWRAMER